MTDLDWIGRPPSHPEHQDGLWSALRRMTASPVHRVVQEPSSFSAGKGPELLAVIRNESTGREIVAVKLPESSEPDEVTGFHAYSPSRPSTNETDHE